MQVTLVISGLLDASASLFADIDAAAPALARLLAAAVAPSVDDQGEVAVACDLLGIVRQLDWPAAPWLARNAGIAGNAAYWLCAAPATLEVGRGDVRLAGTVEDLQPAEAAALLSTLNAHFAVNGLHFHAPDAAHWLAGCATAQSLTTQPPGHALGAPLLACLPAGVDGERWRSWQNEIQMLLFEHPVNVAREAASRAVVNSVWFWGGGASVAGDHSSRIAALYADAWLPRELARAAGVACAAVPASLDVLRDGVPRSPAAVWIDPPAAGEPARLANWVGEVERDWAVPARGALQDGAIEDLAIVALGRSKAVRFNGRRLSLAQRLRSWRSAPRLSTLLAPYLEA